MQCNIAATPRLYANTDPDHTATINGFLAEVRLDRRAALVGDFTITGALTIPPGMVLDLTEATITQAGINKTSAYINARATLIGGVFYGKGTDHAYGEVSWPIEAIGARIVGDDVTILGTEFRHHSDSSLFLTGSAHRFTGEDLRFYGVDGYEGVKIVTGDASCNAIYVNGNFDDITLKNIDVYDSSIGIVSAPSPNMTIAGARLVNIKGQHGLYLQNGDGLSVSNVTGRNVAMNLIKVQLDGVMPSDSRATTITNVNGRDIGTSGLDGSVVSLTQTSRQLQTAAKFRAASVSNISGANCFRGVYLKGVRGGALANCSFVDTARQPLTVFDVQDTVVAGFTSSGSGRSGITVTGGDGSATQRLTIASTRVYDPGKAAVVGDKYGLLISCAADGADGRDITVDGFEAINTAGIMDQGLFFVSGHQESFKLRNADVQGQTAGRRPYRLAAGPRAVAEWHNVNTRGSVTQDFPTALPVYGGSVGEVTLFTRVDGAGKTQLCARLPTGSVAVIAAEGVPLMDW